MPRRIDLVLIALALAMAATPALAQKAPVSLGAAAGTDAATIAATLTAAGCRLTEIDREPAHFETLCTTDAGRWEIYVDAQSGAISKVELADW